jgi:hypothetical protein
MEYAIRRGLQLKEDYARLPRVHRLPDLLDASRSLEADGDVFQRPVSCLHQSALRTPTTLLRLLPGQAHLQETSTIGRARLLRAEVAQVTKRRVVG